ncbi:MAG: type I restriction endonuclease subunit R, partial [Desulfobacteraceae bacterium]|nr:type I restriction endonuclease subunit R [Desulfobacteraceae bacterium]
DAAIARGNRLLEPAKAKPWSFKKQVFLVMDCWDNFEYFKLTPEGKKVDPGLPLFVHIVKPEQDLIEQSQKEAFWADVSDEAVSITRYKEMVEAKILVLTEDLAA